jgi:hypothetical protein
MLLTTSFPGYHWRRTAGGQQGMAWVTEGGKCGRELATRQPAPANAMAENAGTAGLGSCGHGAPFFRSAARASCKGLAAVLSLTCE